MIDLDKRTIPYEPEETLKGFEEDLEALRELATDEAYEFDFVSDEVGSILDRWFTLRRETRFVCQRKAAEFLSEVTNLFPWKVLGKILDHNEGHELTIALNLVKGTDARIKYFHVS